MKLFKRYTYDVYADSIHNYNVVRYDIDYNSKIVCKCKSYEDAHIMKDRYEQQEKEKTHE